MKKIILLLFIGALSFNVFAQSNSLTTGFGILNPKVRVQYEAGFGDMHSAGVNLGYYFVNWTGPRLEGFYRIYFGGDNEKGMFMQASAGAGLFSFAIDEESTTEFTYTENGVVLTSDIYNSSGTWITSGGGIAFGGKMTSRGGFVFESTMGYQIWTPPPSNYSSEYDDYYYLSTGSALDVAETLGYYVVGPGFPLHFQIKLGYNF
jgi:hypothetical protein